MRFYHNLTKNTHLYGGVRDITLGTAASASLLRYYNVWFRNIIFAYHVYSLSLNDKYPPPATPRVALSLSLSLFLSSISRGSTYLYI